MAYCSECGAKKGICVEVGKTYKDRNGDTHEINEYDGFVFWSKPVRGGRHSWHRDGSWLSNQRDSLDLIEEVIPEDYRLIYCSPKGEVGMVVDGITKEVATYTKERAEEGDHVNDGWLYRPCHKSVVGETEAIMRGEWHDRQAKDWRVLWVDSQDGKIHGHKRHLTKKRAEELLPDFTGRSKNSIARMCHKDEIIVAERKLMKAWGDANPKCWCSVQVHHGRAYATGAYYTKDEILELLKNSGWPERHPGDFARACHKDKVGEAKQELQEAWDAAQADWCVVFCNHRGDGSVDVCREFTEEGAKRYAREWNDSLSPDTHHACHKNDVENVKRGLRDAPEGRDANPEVELVSIGEI